MDITEKELRITTLEMAVEDLDKIIANMKEKNYPDAEINEYVKKRWNTWNEIYQVKKQ
jgi:DNA-binding transcriptional regulator YhcF (GntR family)